MKEELQKVVVFDIYGRLAHFRRFSTTSSPLSFCFPPPTTVRGMIGAIVGISKEEYIEECNQLDIAVRINGSIEKTIMMGLNYLDTKEGCYIDPTVVCKRGHTQIRIEFIKDPSYRIYVKAGSEKGVWLLNALHNFVKNGQSRFTVSLGLAQLTANIRYVGKGKMLRVGRVGSVDSVCPSRLIKTPRNKGDKKIVFERVPSVMKSERVPYKYELTLAEITGSTIEGLIDNITTVEYYSEVENKTNIDNVFFFTAQENNVEVGV
ncbi:MAG: type I-B CRISPR-associated protein Cas5b [Brevinematia bacterium]